MDCSPQVASRRAEFETDVRDALATVLYVPQPSLTGQANTLTSTIYVRSITESSSATVVDFDADVSALAVPGL